MFGRLLNTPNFIIRSEERDWLSTNRLRGELRYKWFHRVFVSLAKKPVINSAEQAILVALVLIAAEMEWLRIKGWSVKWLTRFTSFEEVLSYFNGLWAVQTSIASLVYPIVIAFVTLLLQRRHNAKARLYIYLHDSAAVYAGLSSLFLVLTMAIQYLILPQLHSSQVALWVFVDSVWLVWNSITTIWFLYRTFEFLRPDVRTDITTRYAVNIAWHNEVLRNLHCSAFNLAVANNWLPGPSYGEDDAKEKPSILTHFIGRDMGKSIVEIQFNGKREVSDVRFHMLAWVSRRWLRRAATFTKPPGKAGIFGDRKETHVLVFPVFPGEPIEKCISLCRVIGDVPLTSMEKFFARRAFVLTKRKKWPLTLSVREILGDLETEAVSAIAAGDEASFEDLLYELMDLHIVLLKAGISTNSIEKPNNFALLPDRTHVFERPIHEVWSRVYLSLFVAAVKILPANGEFFDHMAHVPGKLFRRLRDVRSKEILEHLLNLPSILANSLGTWWARSVEEQGKLEHNHYSPTLLNPPLLSAHRAAIETFVGAWESLKNHSFPPDRSETVSWDELRGAGGYYEKHLNKTLFMLIMAIREGDQEGAEWMADSLLKWWDSLRFRFDNSSFFLRRGHFLTIELFSKEWEEAKNALDTGIPSFREEGAHVAIFSTCLKNYWIDVCCVALYVLLIWAKECDCTKSLGARLAGLLLTGQPLRPGGNTIGSLKALGDANDVLINILRQYHAEGGYRRGYRARLDNLVENIAGLSKPNMIPGRVYSRWGADDLDALRDGQLMLLCLSIKRKWQPITKVEKIIRQWLTDDNSSVRELAHDLEKWKERLSHAEFMKMDKVFSCISGYVNLKGKLCFTDSITELQAGVQILIDFIDKTQKEAVREAKINEARLDDVAKWSSGLAFSGKSAGFPIWLFREVTTATEAQRERSLLLTNMNKGEFTEPEFVQRASNENKWYAETVRDYVAGQVMTDVLNDLKAVDVVASTPVTYWEELKRAANEIRKSGQKPILLVENHNIPEWIWDWTLTEDDDRAPRPEGLVLQHLKEAEGHGYLGNFNDIAVYVSPVAPGASYVLGREMLDKIQFRTTMDDQYVMVKPEQITGKDELINLRLTWGYTITLGLGSLIRLVYGRRHNHNEMNE